MNVDRDPWNRGGPGAEELIEISASNAAISPVPESPNEPPTSAQVERAARAKEGVLSFGVVDR